MRQNLSSGGEITLDLWLDSERGKSYQSRRQEESLGCRT